MDIENKYLKKYKKYKSKYLRLKNTQEGGGFFCDNLGWFCPPKCKQKLDISEKHEDYEIKLEISLPQFSNNKINKKNLTDLKEELNGDSLAPKIEIADTYDYDTIYYFKTRERFDKTRTTPWCLLNVKVIIKSFTKNGESILENDNNSTAVNLILMSLLSKTDVSNVYEFRFQYDSTTSLSEEDFFKKSLHKYNTDNLITLLQTFGKEDETDNIKTMEIEGTPLFKLKDKIFNKLEKYDCADYIKRIIYR